MAPWLRGHLGSFVPVVLGPVSGVWYPYFVVLVLVRRRRNVAAVVVVGLYTGPVELEIVVPVRFEMWIVLV